jgi:hypothetical protein
MEFSNVTTLTPEEHDRDTNRKNAVMDKKE